MKGRWGNLLRGILFAAIYFTIAKIGLLLASLNQHSSPFWPASGYAVGVLLLYGRRYWPSIWVAAFLANFLNGSPLSTIFLIACGNTLEALAGQWIASEILKKKSFLNFQAEALAILAAAALATTASANIGVIGLALGKLILWSDFIHVWWTWWLGDFLGVLLVAPVFVIVHTNSIKEIWRANRRPYEASLLFIFLSLFCYLLFVRGYFPNAFLFLICPFLLAIVIRFGKAEVWCASVFICAISVFAAAKGFGPFSSQSQNENLLHLVLFLSALTLTALVLSGFKEMGISKLPTLSLLFGWSLSALLLAWFERDIGYRDKEHLEELKERAHLHLQNRIHSYEDILRAAAGLFDASQVVNREDWRAYFERQNILPRFPGIKGMGVIYPVTEKGLRPHLLKTRADGSPRFEYKSIEKKKMSDHAVITYIEPLEGNEKAEGLDIFSESRRRFAAEFARDTGLATLTEPIQLVQDSIHSLGYLQLIPVYKRGLPTETAEQRRKALMVWVYIPFTGEEFFRGLFEDISTELDAIVIDPSSARSAFFSRALGVAHKPTPSINDEVSMGQRTFKVIWRPAHHFQSTKDYAGAWIAFFGSIVTLLVAVVILELQTTERRASQRAQELTAEIQERKRTWKTLTELSPVGIFKTDLNGQCTYVNPKWCELSGMEKNSALGKGWMEAIHPEDRARVSENWNAFLKSKNFSLEFRFQKKADPSDVYVLAAAAAISDSAGRVIGSIATFQDLTLLKQQQASLISSSKLSSLGEMAGNIAHEINNPLAVIHGKAEMLLGKMEKGSVNLETSKPILDSIIRTVHRIAKIVRGLKSIARDGQNDAMSSYLLSEIVENALELCRERFKSHNIELECLSIPEGRLLCRSVEISQVLLNLLSNAFDAVEDLPEPWVKIEFKEIGNWLQIAVTDSGAGIPKIHIGRVMEPFFTTKEIGKGTGLGLSISKRIIVDHGGALDIDALSENTKFVIQLPRYQAASATSTSSSSKIQTS